MKFPTVELAMERSLAPKKVPIFSQVLTLPVQSRGKGHVMRDTESKEGERTKGNRRRHVVACREHQFCTREDSLFQNRGSFGRQGGITGTKRLPHIGIYSLGAKCFFMPNT